MVELNRGVRSEFTRPGYHSPLLHLPSEFASWAELEINERIPPIRILRIVDIVRGATSARRCLNLVCLASR